ncbi:536_t:CDS:1 [Gigaspora margarita]|uniref:536_t:CDS:1 n=1 Tax=Gigaspora margarita TaxID=4874 RepID=A0ABN7V9E7_GIGMA|nr:536_t:CDS:1 [Gigaspora margarita]
MNKKFSFCLLIALIAMIVIPSIASVISQRNNISNALAFRPSKRIKEASRFKNKYKRSKGNKIRSNVIEPFVSVVNPNHNYPIGRLFFADESEEISCTANVINTSNGNIGLTAAHCLLDDNGNPLNLSLISFSPGYDNRTNGPLGDIPVADIAIPLQDNNNDYALVRFAFNDPDRRGARLQDYTGALGWRFDIGNIEQTSVFGYPGDGDMEDCARDGRHLCKWQGITELYDTFYSISNVDLGDGASGGPYISQYDIETNLGYVYAVFGVYLTGSKLSVADIWEENIFLGLLLSMTPNNII